MQFRQTLIFDIPENLNPQATAINSPFMYKLISLMLLSHSKEKIWWLKISNKLYADIYADMTYPCPHKRLIQHKH